MKIIFYILLVISFLEIISFISCNDEDAKNPDYDSLKVVVNPADTNIYMAGKQIAYLIEMSSDEKLKKLTISGTVNSSPISPEKKALGDFYYLSHTYIFTIPAWQDSTFVELSFLVEDASETVSECESFTVVAAETSTVQ